MRTGTKAILNRHGVVALLFAATAALMALTPGPVRGLEATPDGPELAGLASSEEPITVRVRNNNWLDMRVYAVVNGRRWRLGTAYTGQQAVLEVPAHIRADIVPLELVAYPIGGSGSAETGELLPSAGDQIDWVLENNLSLSTVFMVRATTERD